MSTIIKNPQQAPGKHRLYSKGAAEIVLNSCNFIHYANGKKPMTEDNKKEILEMMKGFNKNALRTLSVAYKDLEVNENGEKHDEKTSDDKFIVEESGLTLIGIFGIRDTIRVGVKEAVDICRTAGIKVRMVTGDNKTTAAAIAKDCHILPEDFDEDQHPNAVTEGPIFAQKLGGLINICNKCSKEICNCL